MKEELLLFVTYWREEELGAQAGNCEDPPNSRRQLHPTWLFHSKAQSGLRLGGGL